MSKIQVALIGDDEFTRTNLRRKLQYHDEIIWIGEASQGQEGLLLLYEKKPDVAIVDLDLGEFDGIELTKQFKSDQDKRTQTKIIILTANNQKHQVLGAFRAGADSYCLKNIKIELLIEAVKTTYQGNTWIDPVIAPIILSQAKANLSHSCQSSSLTENFLKHTPLTERELEVLQLIVDGYSNAQISEQLYITVGTVKTHVRNILNKLCADDRTQAAVRALRSGLVA
ncbi:two component transcriptional regulator, LuxR family [Rippkaea orientalis PCC 8801]|uniref:Two component transcriptional regulator, LuxR family n=1 Tax=Rippkaea orientalis (strain PCC 8801 / RF-1) TaxID=41431 RepID=B7K2I7_RIPO1|nr:response regulator transcription factor [Rippkaea orientalis]ACK66380.1 two component transcriptional regulator, LuxR family [Rippkaea orientalis PCC 8801]